MGLTDFAQMSQTPQVAYMFPELDPIEVLRTNTAAASEASAKGDLFVFQYWPAQLVDNYEVEYARKTIPGVSHPIYQYIAGGGRTLSFDAIFTSEVDDNAALVGARGALNSLPLLSSSRYSVNVDAAINGLQKLQYPRYVGSQTQPPPRLRLVFPGSRIGRGAHDSGVTKDSILVFLTKCSVTIESWFPSGVARIATASLEFTETVQQPATSRTNPNVTFIGSDSFTKTSDYNYRGSLKL